MAEIMRFRLTRAPQKRAPDPDVCIPVFREKLDTLTGLRAYMEGNDGPLDLLIKDILNDPSPYVPGYEIGGATVLDKPATLATPIDHLENWLTGRGNQPDVKELSGELNKLSKTFYDVSGKMVPATSDLKENARFLIQIAGDDWWIDRLNIGLSLIVAIILNSEPSRSIYFNRLMQVIGLVELAVENPDRLKTIDNVYWALRWRSTILPQVLLDHFLNLRPNSLLARRPGFADLYIRMVAMGNWTDVRFF